MENILRNNKANFKNKLYDFAGTTYNPILIKKIFMLNCKRTEKCTEHVSLLATLLLQFWTFISWLRQVEMKMEKCAKI